MSALDPHALAAFDQTPATLARFLAANGALFPEFAAAQADLTTFRKAARTRAVLAETAPLLHDLDNLPATTYSRYRAFARTGDRAPYETPYYGKRERLHAAALHLLLGEATYRDAVHDYLWAICEETTWVAPAHTRVIDIMAAETAFGLAEIVALLGPTLDAEVRYRVRDEIERRIFAPFLHGYYDLRWFNGGDNWNGVCAGAIGGAFLYLEPDPERLARGLALILESLRTFVATAFAADGSTTEGVGYWHYGLTYPIIFAELLRGRTGGALDLLADPRLRRIAAFPAAMLLAEGRFANFADATERTPLNPGLIARLAARSGATGLLGTLAPIAPLQGAAASGLSRTLRDLLWWDGAHHVAPSLADTLLPASGIARLAARTKAGVALALAVKAGHNDENHNHNDIGSFILHVADETLLADPGPGRYDREYFNERRYENPFANSLGHSVPRVAGQLQGTGRTFTGKLAIGADATAATGKTVTIDFTSAYPVERLTAARRTLTLAATADGDTTLLLHDQFTFTGAGEEVEEALITWLPVTLAGATATIHGQRHHLTLTIEAPAEAQFALTEIAGQATDDTAAATLHRLHFTIPPAATSEARIQMAISAR
jgi:hypothetical protein